MLYIISTEKPYIHAQTSNSGGSGDGGDMFQSYLGSIVMEDKLAFVDGTKKRRAKALRKDHMAMKEKYPNPYD
jgi:hypothetical protein